MRPKNKKKTTELKTALKNKIDFGNSLVVQWLGLCAFTAKGLGSIPGRGTKIPKATRCSQKKKKKIDLETKQNKKEP